jgi:hypothetical protein
MRRCDGLVTPPAGPRVSTPVEWLPEKAESSSRDEGRRSLEHHNPEVEDSRQMRGILDQQGPEQNVTSLREKDLEIGKELQGPRRTSKVSREVFIGENSRFAH